MIELTFPLWKHDGTCPCGTHRGMYEIIEQWSYPVGSNPYIKYQIYVDVQTFFVCRLCGALNESSCRKIVYPPTLRFERHKTHYRKKRA